MEGTVIEKLIDNREAERKTMKHYDVIVVIPIGPNSVVEFIIDTIDSYIHYTHSSYKIILIDDSHQNIGNKITQIFPEYDIIHTLKPMGGWAGLYITLSTAFSYALKNYSFKALLKLDTDALVIGAAPEKAALTLFKNKPYSGIAGQYPFEYDGTPWNIKWPQRRILNSTRHWKFLRRPIANFALIKLYNKALKNGYKTGESVFGGAYFMNELYLANLHQQGLLPKYAFQSLNIGEDHLFSLLAKASGFSLESLSMQKGPMGCAWKGLPVSPDRLLQDNKKIVHSVRSWNDMDESNIREFFKSKRQFPKKI